VSGVAEAVALGVPDRRLGQAILLLVRPGGVGADAGGGADAAALEEAIRGRFRAEMPNYMMPGEIRMIEHFPKTPNGKIDRVALAGVHAHRAEEKNA